MEYSTSDLTGLYVTAGIMKRSLLQDEIREQLPLLNLSICV